MRPVLGPVVLTVLIAASASPAVAVTHGSKSHHPTPTPVTTPTPTPTSTSTTTTTTGTTTSSTSSTSSSTHKHHHAPTPTPTPSTGDLGGGSGDFGQALAGDPPPVIGSGPSGSINLPGGTVDAVDHPHDPAVPEPATWAMMLVGFGAAGVAMRRGRKKTSKAPSQLA